MDLLPAIERSAGERFRGSSQEAMADGADLPRDFYVPFQAAGLLWVAEADSRLIGFAACEAFDDALHVWELDVVKDAQGQGVGRALIAAAAGEARRRERPALTLTTFASIPWNAPFYEHVGFRRLADTDLNARLGEVLAHEAERGLTDRCAMRLRL